MPNFKFDKSAISISSASPIVKKDSLPPITPIENLGDSDFLADIKLSSLMDEEEPKAEE